MPSLKVAVLGAAGGIGQPLSLLLKQNPHITELALFDVAPVVKGVAVDISHINTPSTVTGHVPDGDGLAAALTGANLVVIPAGVPRKPGMTRDDLFKINAGIVRDLATSMAKNCPKACILVISNPVNSTVPIVAEVFKKAGVFDAKKLFGVTTLDVVRASTFVSEVAGQSEKAHEYKIPVIGGHSGVTILPLLSQSKPPLPQSLLSDKSKIAELVKRIQFGGDEVVAAKDGAGSATLSMAFAGFRFAESLIKARLGQSGVIEMGYIYVADDKHISAHTEGLEYFSVPIELGAEGVGKLLPIGDINDHEKEMLKACVSELKESITKPIVSSLKQKEKKLLQ
ncbi:malate dehydrogenase, NAD-dependent [Puccinia sorghi]|uniref:Malate dehydrogenase n=1 Tax=Puccinia sorghi TaxID=27349 RepID=A0A0L6UAP8_9BASI|nr:malate dehydrogenase, NAD-dependent [Puccinia sorghi]